MTYDEFERQLLKIVFEEQKDSLTPSFLAYKLQLPHTTVKDYLDLALENGIVELSADDEGKITYFVPGFDPNTSIAQKKYSSDPIPSPRTHHTTPNRSREESFEEAARREVDEIAPHSPISSNHSSHHTHSDNLPAIVDDSTEITKGHPRYSVYIRKFRIYGDYTEDELSQSLYFLLSDFGYKFVEDPKDLLLDPDNQLYKRGSFMFILLLIPFFILLIPLLVYAIFYTTGHSTIRNEPVLLEVGKKRLDTTDPVWEITLTFRGQHGIVFGKPDRALIDKEVDLIIDEMHSRNKALPNR